MDWFWTWADECFGYRNGDSLFTYLGLEVLKFNGDKIYGSDKRYLGEVKNDNRLITSRSKKNWRRGASSQEWVVPTPVTRIALVM